MDVPGLRAQHFRTGAAPQNRTALPLVPPEDDIRRKCVGEKEGAGYMNDARIKDSPGLPPVPKKPVCPTCGGYDTITYWNAHGMQRNLMGESTPNWERETRCTRCQSTYPPEFKFKME